MSLPIQFHVDPERRPRARWTGHDPEGRALAEFLETDLGAHRAFALRILDEGRRIRSVDHGAYSASGNVFSLRIAPDVTEIAPLRDDLAIEPLRVPTVEFLATVERWRHLLDDLAPLD